MSISREAIHIGSFAIYFYGLIIMAGAVLAAWVASKQAKKFGSNPEAAWDMFIWLILAGIVGARIWHILTPSPSLVEKGITTAYYLTHPLDALNTRSGGLGIPGAVIGGVVALYFYTRKYKLNFAQWADFVAPGLALAQAVGRWGNFVNQELYGAPTSLPWKLFVEPAYRLPGYQDTAYYHPLFLYESLYNLANMGILLWVSRVYQDRLKHGDVFLLYCVIYPIGRFLLEFLRLDASMVGSLNANQTVMAVIALASAVALYWRHRERPGGAQPAEGHEA